MDSKQDEILTRLPKPLAKLAKVPKDTPARKSWHVERQRVTESVRESLFCEAGPRVVVGLVGDSGSGKTTAASEIVRSVEGREYFSDGIVWLSVDQGAKDRLPSLMLQLARTVHEDIGGSLGSPPSVFDDGAAYCKEWVGKGHGGKGLRCLVVADNVWEQEVVDKLRETGMWVLFTTRDEDLAERASGEPVVIDELSEEDAEAVLVGAAELPADAHLPESARDVIKLCGRVAMDLAFVGRWSAVRGREDPAAWSDAAAKITVELEEVGFDAAGVASDSDEDARAKQRRAILRAGFEDLAIGTDDDRVQRLYLSLAVVPDGHVFGANDAAVLLYGRGKRCSAEDVEAAREVVETLERWTIVCAVAEGGHRMHDAHSSFARECLVDREYVRRPAVERWVEHISSLEALRSVDKFVMLGMWWAVERVTGDQGWRKTRPYGQEASEMDDYDPLCRESLAAVAGFRGAKGDRAGEKAAYRRLLRVEQRTLGPHDPNVVSTLWRLGNCAERMGRADEARKWRQREYETVHLALSRMRFQSESVAAAAGRRGGRGEGKEDTANGLRSLASGMLRVVPGRLDEAEKLLRRAVEIEEARLGPHDIQVAVTLHQLGVCVRDAGRKREAEGMLRRALEIKESKLGPTNVYVAVTLHELGVCVRETARSDEAEAFFRRALEIWQGKLGLASGCIADTQRQLDMCVRRSTEGGGVKGGLYGSGEASFFHRSRPGGKGALALVVLVAASLVRYVL